jgi:AraC-like DNA-binding protein
MTPLKLKGLIGQAPGELVRIVRLQYAHDLSERRVATVSEVAYMVGFGSPASFSASFSRHFGLAPSKVVEAWYLTPDNSFQAKLFPYDKNCNKIESICNVRESNFWVGYVYL